MGYTHNWNSEFIRNVNGLGKFDLCLEIGCFEGLTSNYICDNLLTENGRLLCLDPLSDNYLNNDLSDKDKNDNETIYKYFNNQYERFIDNVKHQISGNKLTLYRNISSEIFPSLIKEFEGKIDFIYIDGDHRASMVYIDAVNSFKLIKSGGIIVFDDYAWGKSYGDEATSVGIDKFLNEYLNEYVLIHSGSQVVIKKN